MRARFLLRSVLLLLCIVVSTAGLINVYADNQEVMDQAKALACGEKACSLTHMDRTPFSQNFEFTSRSGTAVAHCARSAIFVGEYRCAR